MRHSTGEAILRQFDHHSLVLLGEQHRRKEFHDFLQALLSDPRFPGHVNDIVVEFGNSRHQDVVDRYVSGEAVDRETLRRVWRDTTQLLVWDSPIYEGFFKAVRDLNRRLSPSRRVRVLLGEPPIDWSSVTDKAGYGVFAERDLTFVDLVEQHVIARGRKALLVIGGTHVLRTASSETMSAHPGVGDLLATRHPGMAYSVFAVRRNAHSPDSAIARQLFFRPRAKSVIEASAK